MRLGDYYDGFYKGYMRYLAPGTAQGYDGDWRNHIAGEFAGWEMEDIRVRHINAWLASDHFAGIPGAARSAYKTLRQILRSAMGDELYSDEVVDPTTRGIRLPPMDTGYEPPYLRTGIVLIERGLQVIGGEVVETKVQKMLGHESLGMGYRYMSLDEDVLREDQAAYERLILRA